MFAKEIHNIHHLTALTLLILGLLCPVALLAGPTAGAGGVVFSFKAPAAKAVFLAGDFNGWNAADLPLVNDGAGNWSVSVTLAAGTYEYKFVADGQWLEDPTNPVKKTDPFGGANSVLTVGADGSPAAESAGAPVTVPAAAAATVSTDDIKVGAPRDAEGGIAFTFHDSGAQNVALAGSFNGWNADELPLKGDGKGNWLIVKELAAGSHEYKFVVDGNWLADPENPDTQSDPYGGVNSIITVDDKGKLTATKLADAAATTTNNTLNAKVTIDGRYLTRFEYAKNVAVNVNDESQIDPRYRLQRPTQSVDLNFHTEVSEMTRTFMRLRLDSDQNIIQNNIAAFLDEANLEVHPGNFDLKAYWNQEVFSGEDMLKLGGDLDLPGTIMHEHLDYGKGSAGALFVANPLGVRTRLFFANVHNADYYNDPDLFDNTGQDNISLRFSRQFGKFEIGTPLYAERSLVWMDFGELVSLPSTGIPALDEHRANTGDTSTWYEVDKYRLNGGLDLRYNASENWSVATEALYRNSAQRFATGNEAGQNNTNGVLDVPFLDRNEWVLALRAEFQASEHSTLAVQHQSTRMDDGNADERQMVYSFKSQAEANKNIFFDIAGSPAVADLDSTELTWNWQRDNRSAALWLRRAGRDFDYGVVGRGAPEDTTVSSHSEEIWYLAGSIATGRSEDRFGHVELEAGYNLADRGVAGLQNNQLEMILRYDRDLSRNFGLIADLRFIGYHLEAEGTDDTNTDYFNPFVGFRYTPIRKLQLVAAYGVDPVDYSIDYNGRELGRWMYRQNYLFDHPGATNLDAENNLKKARVFTLRAQLLF